MRSYDSPVYYTEVLWEPGPANSPGAGIEDVQ